MGAGSSATGGWGSPVGGVSGLGLLPVGGLPGAGSTGFGPTGFEASGGATIGLLVSGLVGLAGLLGVGLIGSEGLGCDGTEGCWPGEAGMSGVGITGSVITGFGLIGLGLGIGLGPGLVGVGATLGGTLGSLALGGVGAGCCNCVCWPPFGPQPATEPSRAVKSSALRQALVATKRPGLSPFEVIKGLNKLTSLSSVKTEGADVRNP